MKISIKKFILVCLSLISGTFLFATESSVQAMNARSRNGTLFSFDLFSEAMNYNPVYALHFENKIIADIHDTFDFQRQKEDGLGEKFLNNDFSGMVAFPYKKINFAVSIFNTSDHYKSDFEITRDRGYKKNSFLKDMQKEGRTIKTDKNYFGATIVSAFTRSDGKPVGIRTSFTENAKDDFYSFDLALGTFLQQDVHELSFWIPLNFTYNDEDAWNKNLELGINFQDRIKISETEKCNLFLNLTSDFAKDSDNFYYELPVKIGASYENTFAEKILYFAGTDSVLSISNKAFENGEHISKKENERYFDFDYNICFNSCAKVLLNRKVELMAGIEIPVLESAYTYHSRKYTVSEYKKKNHDFDLFREINFSCGVSLKPADSVKIDFFSAFNNFSYSKNKDNCGFENKKMETSFKAGADVTVYF